MNPLLRYPETDAAHNARRTGRIRLKEAHIVGANTDAAEVLKTLLESLGCKVVDHVALPRKLVNRKSKNKPTKRTK